jgi:hypothetical protein
MTELVLMSGVSCKIYRKTESSKLRRRTWKEEGIKEKEK